MEEPFKQGCFIVWLPVVIIKRATYKEKKVPTLKQNKVFKPNYK